MSFNAIRENKILAKISEFIGLFIHWQLLLPVCIGVFVQDLCFKM